MSLENLPVGSWPHSDEMKRETWIKYSQSMDEVKGLQARMDGEADAGLATGARYLP